MLMAMFTHASGNVHKRINIVRLVQPKYTTFNNVMLQIYMYYLKSSIVDIKMGLMARKIGGEKEPNN